MKSIRFRFLVAALAVMLGRCDRQVANCGRNPGSNRCMGMPSACEGP